MSSKLLFPLAVVTLLFSFATISVVHADDEKGDKSKAQDKSTGEGDEHAKEGDDGHKKDAHKDGADDTHAKGDDAHKKGDDGHKEGDGGHGGGGGHGHHDETDLSHANAGAELEAPQEFKYDLAIWTLVVFLLLMLILRVYAWGPIMDGLTQREERIASMIAEAEKNAEQSRAKAAEYEAKLAAATEEARALVATARKDADAAKDRILAEAEEARQKDRERFQADIDAAKASALDEVAQRGTQIAVDLAGQIINRELKPDDHEKLIRESLDRFSSNN